MIQQLYKYDHLEEPAEFPQPSKLLALSDIEGEFEALQNLLISNKVTDNNNNWIFGDGHLVVCGDLFDRGVKVMECLSLLYELEEGAKREGGYVHIILGNHEIMNLSGDLAYVNPLYFQARRSGVRYEDMLTENTKLGAWLRTKNIIEKIGNGIFLHAGISEEVNALKLSITEINKLCRPWYDVNRFKLPAPVRPLYGNNGPFWYRGYLAQPKATKEQIETTIKLYDVEYIVVGHTMVDHVSSFYNDKIIALDVDQHSGTHEGLLIENGNAFRVNDKGRRFPLK